MVFVNVTLELHYELLAMVRGVSGRKEELKALDWYTFKFVVLKCPHAYCLPWFEITRECSLVFTLGHTSNGRQCRLLWRFPTNPEAMPRNFKPQSELVLYTSKYFDITANTRNHHTTKCIIFYQPKHSDKPINIATTSQLLEICI